MDLTADDNDAALSDHKSTYLSRDPAKPSTSLPRTETNPVLQNGLIFNTLRPHSCKENCALYCQKSQCPKYAALSNFILPDQGMPREYCMQSNGDKYANKNVEEYGFVGQYIDTQPTTSPNECDTKDTCPTKSERVLAESTDHRNLAETKQEAVFPLGLQPTCVVTKSEYYHTPEPIPYLLCPHCCGKIHVLSAIGNQNKTPVNEVFTFTGSQMSPNQVNLCIQPTPPSPCPARFPVSQTHAAPPSGTLFRQATCPHFQQTNSPCEACVHDSATRPDLSTCRACGYNHEEPSRHHHSHKSSNQERSAQFQSTKQTSTMVLYMEPNLTNKPSTTSTNMFYDIPNCSTKNLENPEHYVCALKKLTAASRQLLENFEKAMKNKEKHGKGLKVKQKYSLPFEEPEPVKYVIPLALKIRSPTRK